MLLITMPWEAEVDSKKQFEEKKKRMKEERNLCFVSCP